MLSRRTPIAEQSALAALYLASDATALVVDDGLLAARSTSSTA